ncbi:hypothetical protein HK097_004645 [Rhizophlyctis rosea]|uniref:Chitin-binding type-1 domain-containing protein n=1 Tax=Rhizophlyctis rosea TaxID=64517 RepID=A0AAD5X737_9FUNG|nr:hypothetical protein HK097_004645 [Rhizophlyctis rosea]
MLSRHIFLLVVFLALWFVQTDAAVHKTVKEIRVVGDGSKCGNRGNGAICAKGLCCSTIGYCGKTSNHCEVGKCQSKFGFCLASAPAAVKVKTLYKVHTIKATVKTYVKPVTTTTTTKSYATTTSTTKTYQKPATTSSTTKVYSKPVTNSTTTKTYQKPMTTSTTVKSYQKPVKSSTTTSTYKKPVTSTTTTTTTTAIPESTSTVNEGSTTSTVDVTSSAEESTTSINEESTTSTATGTDESTTSTTEESTTSAEESTSSAEESTTATEASTTTDAEETTTTTTIEGDETSTSPPEETSTSIPPDETFPICETELGTCISTNTPTLCGTINVSCQSTYSNLCTCNAGWKAPNNQGFLIRKLGDVEGEFVKPYVVVPLGVDCTEECEMDGCLEVREQPERLCDTEGGSVCFPMYAKVGVKGGEKRMDEVVAGDFVEVLTKDGEKVLDEIIYVFRAARRGVVYSVLEYVTDDGKIGEFHLTPTHTLANSATRTSSRNFVQAKEVLRHTYIHHITHGPVLVTKTSQRLIQAGGYAAIPRTPGALMIVDGVIASPWGVQHYMMDTLFGTAFRIVYAMLKPMNLHIAFMENEWLAKASNFVSPKIPFYYEWYRNAVESSVGKVEL